MSPVNDDGVLRYRLDTLPLEHRVRYLHDDGLALGQSLLGIDILSVYRENLRLNGESKFLQDRLLEMNKDGWENSRRMRCSIIIIYLILLTPWVLDIDLENILLRQRDLDLHTMELDYRFRSRNYGIRDVLDYGLTYWTNAWYVFRIRRIARMIVRNNYWYRMQIPFMLHHYRNYPMERCHRLELSRLSKGAKWKCINIFFYLFCYLFVAYHVVKLPLLLAYGLWRPDHLASLLDAMRPFLEHFSDNLTSLL